MLTEERREELFRDLLLVLTDLRIECAKLAHFDRVRRRLNGGNRTAALHELTIFRERLRNCADKEAQSLLSTLESMAFTTEAAACLSQWDELKPACNQLAFTNLFAASDELLKIIGGNEWPTHVDDFRLRPEKARELSKELGNLSWSVGRFHAGSGTEQRFFSLTIKAASALDWIL